jgi:hypothetical protein
MWREYVSRLTNDCEFFSPVSTEQVAAVGRALNIVLPSELQALLYETNGILGPHKIRMIWSIERIKEDNLSFRRNNIFLELYMPFTDLLFIGDAGNGDQFAFPILSAAVRKPDIYGWNHETDSRVWVAPSLEKYIEWYLEKKLKL